MKNLIYNIGFFLSLALLFSSCQEDDVQVGDITAPSNIEITVEIVGADASNPNGDGSGEVNLIATASNAISYQFVYNNNITSAPAGKQKYEFVVLGLNTYAVTVIAFGTGGASASKTIEIEVLSLYDAPADLTEMLHANGERSWRIAAELPVHFGLGPPGGFVPGEWFPGGGSTDTNYKENRGIYDDRYIFNADGTFTHDTGIDEAVFGRIGFIEELAGSGGEVEGDDIINYPYPDYNALWTLSAPGGVETINLTGTAFIGYYTGGNHKYRIFEREPNKMILSTLDGNGEFEWWFTLVPE